MRIGFTVSKALGGSVERNRMRRRTREAVRHHLCMLKGMSDAVDVVINPKKSLLTAEFPQISQEIERAFRVIRQSCEGAGKEEWQAGGAAPMRKLILMLLAAYKRWLSPQLPVACRFTPTCSEYAAEAVTRHGALGGTLAGAVASVALPSPGRARVRPGSRTFLLPLREQRSSGPHRIRYEGARTGRGRTRTVRTVKYKLAAAAAQIGILP